MKPPHDIVEAKLLLTLMFERLGAAISYPPKRYPRANDDFPVPSGLLQFSPAGDSPSYGVVQDWPQILYGSCDDNTPCYSMVQEAINAASSGSTIKIAIIKHHGQIHDAQ